MTTDWRAHADRLDANAFIPIIERDGKVIEYPHLVYGLYSTALEIAHEIADRRNRLRRLFMFWSRS